MYVINLQEFRDISVEYVERRKKVEGGETRETVEEGDREKGDGRGGG